VLGHVQDAEDAFQATFLVLARKAAQVTPREMVANWLYGVAYRTAVKARSLRAKQRAREKQVTVMPDPPAAPRDDLGAALRQLLDRELSRLPDKYRVPVVLCDLEGKTQKVAAQQLGWPEGTVSSRLARARAMLARRLTRYGLGSSAGSLAAVLSQEAASAGIPTALMASTVKAACGFATRQAVAAGVVSAEVATLTERVLRSMFLSRITTVAVVVLTALAFTTGTGVVLAPAGSPDPQTAKVAAPAETPKQEDGAVRGRELAETYYRNAALADEKYTGKKITVEGYVRRITRTATGGYALQMPLSYSTTIATGGGGRGGGGATSLQTTVLLLSFEFGAEERKQLATIDSSKWVTIEGRCDGLTINRTDGPETVRFRDCRIVKVEERAAVPPP
jgi:RNA polymerase sigma factor (sigma-70 family)